MAFEMTLEEVYSNLLQAKENGITTILIGGGEPTLHSNIIDIGSQNAARITIIIIIYPP